MQELGGLLKLGECSDQFCQEENRNGSEAVKVCWRSRQETVPWCLEAIHVSGSSPALPVPME